MDLADLFEVLVMDVLFLSLILVFFLLTLGLLYGCDKLRGSP
ncbi:protein of unknown function [Candidatus Methylocalor cossyra]|uniref:Uncharacterized protein n=1 Tax=Candidatus Methylocalor cossyra TaxID=3108543 RepID=A0ABM9NGR7_9GAMM